MARQVALRPGRPEPEGEAASGDAVPSTVSRLPAVLVAGTVVGFLTGFFGVGGGFVVVPALVLTLGFTMQEAVGTSLVVIVINAVMALLLRGHPHVEWAEAAPFLVAALVGTLFGRAVSDRVDARRLTTAFVVLLVVLALWTGGSSIAGLLGS